MKIFFSGKFFLISILCFAFGVIAVGTVFGQERNSKKVEASEFAKKSTLSMASQSDIITALGLNEEDVISIDFNNSDPNGYTVMNGSGGGFSKNGESFFVMSTGLASVALDSKEFQSWRLGGLNSPAGQDMVQMRLELRVPENANSLTFDSKFFTEEYPDFVGTDFNDGFIVERGTSNFTISGTNISAPNNVVFDEVNRDIITINSQFASGDDQEIRGNADGTTYNGALPLLTTEVDVSGTSTITLIFSIFDIGDDAYDSSVFLDNFRFDVKEEEIVELELLGVEVNQAIQDWNNSVFLVRGKNTVVRAHIQSKNESTPTVNNIYLRGTRNGVELPGSPLRATANSFKVPSYADLSENSGLVDLVNRRSDNRESLNFKLPYNWLNDTVQLQLITGNNLILDCHNSVSADSDCYLLNNTYSSSVSKNFKFEIVEIPEIKFVNIYWDDGDKIIVPQYDLERWVKITESILPVEKINYSIRNQSIYFHGFPNRVGMLTRVGMARTLDGCAFNSQCDTIYYGIAPKNSINGGQAGVSSAVSPADPKQFTLHVHELGHVYGLGHNPIGLAPYCSSQRGFPNAISETINTKVGTNFNIDLNKPTNKSPYGSHIGPNYPSQVNGYHIEDYDYNEWLYGYSSFDFKKDPIIDPIKRELMTYCGSYYPQLNNPEFLYQWISKTNYNELKKGINNKHIKSKQDLKTVEIVEIYSGEITYDNTVNLNPIYTVENLYLSEQNIQSPYRLEILDEEGTKIKDYGIEVLSTSESGGTSSYFLIAVEAEPEKNEVRITYNNLPLSSISSEGGAPSIEIISPSGNQTASGSTFSFEWEGQSDHTDELYYTIQFSRDGGNSWNTLQIDYPETSYEVPVSSLGRTDEGKLRVIVSDGFHSAYAESEGFLTVGNSLPQAYLSSPHEGNTYIGQGQMFLDGFATDLEDGSIDGSTFSWQSNLDGEIATGNKVLVTPRELTEGEHQLTLIVQDSDGGIGEETVSIKIQHFADPVTTPTPTERPGPVQQKQPENGSEDMGMNPVFEWDSALRAEQYRLQVADNSDFESPAIDLTTGQTRFEYFGGLKPNTTYYWRMSGINAIGNGDWSSIWQFTTESIKPPSGLKLNEINNRINLEWTESTYSNTTEYRIYKGTGTGSLSYHESTITTTFSEDLSEEGSIYYAVTVKDDQDNESTLSNVVSHFNTKKTISDNWELVSLPLESDGIEVSNAQLFGFERSYQRGDVMIPGAGYWLKSEEVQELELRGRGLTESILELHKGWNLIGGLSVDVPIESINDPSDILAETPVYAYSQGSYQQVSVLEPDQGYWIFANKPGVIVIRGGEAQSVTKSKIDDSKSISASFDQHVINFQSGDATQHLFITEEPLSDSDITNFMLPPKAPVPLLDVRTHDGHSIAQILNSKIELNSSELPVEATIEMDGEFDSEYGYRLVGSEGQNEVHYNLIPGQIAFINQQLDSFIIEKVRSDELITDYKLYPNYPNPFNPVTNIRYQLPERSNVQIEVFDIIGRRIKVLVNTDKEAGIYTLKFDGSRYASGMYLLRFQTENHLDIQKITLIK